MLGDRSEYAHNPQYEDRMPAAFATCNGPAGTQIHIVAFSPASVAPDAFVDRETAELCSATSGVQAALGDAWAIIATNVAVAERAAVRTRGRAQPPVC